MSDVQFFTTGFVTAEWKGPLSVSLLTPTGLTVVEVVFGAPAIAARLDAGEPVADVLGELNSLQKTETTIPIDRLQSLTWVDGYNGIRISWQDDRGRMRRKTIYIASAAARTQLLENLAGRIAHRPHETMEPAGVLQLAWSQLLGAVLSVLLTVVFLLLWDVQRIAQVRGGRIALWLGPTGCALVGVAFLIGCLISAWRRLSPRPMEHCWSV
jgi:hypothetical protein